MFILEYSMCSSLDTLAHPSFEDLDSQPAEIQQQRLLPGVKDPNLWTIKCRIGSEKETAIILMKKCISLQFSDNVCCLTGASHPVSTASFFCMLEKKAAFFQRAKKKWRLGTRLV